MSYAYIVFWDDEEKPIRITPAEHKKIYDSWEKLEHIKLPNGHIFNKKTIKHIKPPGKSEPLRLEAPKEKPISKERLQELKMMFAKKFI